MRYLLDTNIFVYLALDNDMLSRDVYDIINDPENLFYMSAESVRELIVAYRNKQLGIKRWKTAEEMVEAIERDYYVEILPIQKEVMQTFAAAHQHADEPQGPVGPRHHRPRHDARHAAHIQRHPLRLLPTTGA